MRIDGTSVHVPETVQWISHYKDGCSFVERAGQECGPDRSWVFDCWRIGLVGPTCPMQTGLWLECDDSNEWKRLTTVEVRSCLPLGLCAIARTVVIGSFSQLQGCSLSHDFL